MYTPVMFIAALFTVATTWKQPNVHQQMNGLRRCGIIHNRILLNHKKEKKKTMPFAPAWMELETLILSEVSKEEKDKYNMISLISGT